MAQFNADILFNADVRKALQGVNKLEGGVRSLVTEIEKFENTFKRIAAGPSNRVALAQQRQIAGAINEQNRALAAQVAIASQLASRYDSAAVAAAQFARSIQQAQRASQKLLPGTGPGQRALPAAGGSSQKLLPAAGGTGAEARVFERRAQEAAAIDKAAAAAVGKKIKSTEDVIRAANAFTQALIDETQGIRNSIRARDQVTQAVQQQQKLLTGSVQKLLPSSQMVQSGPSKGVGERAGFGGDRFRKKLQAEVDRQVKLTGTLNDEVRQQIESFNRRQVSSNKVISSESALIKATDDEAARKERLANKKRFIAGAKAARRRQQRLGEDLALGAGFPLLMGGGAGAVGGGILGAIAGQGKGGFGLQILFSALGQVVDDFASKAANLSTALNTTGDATQQLETFLGRLDNGLKNRIKNLSASGQAAAAADAAFKELARQIGEENARALIQAGQDYEKVGNEFQRFTTQVGALVANLVQDALYLNINRPPVRTGPSETQVAQRRTEDLGRELEVSQLLTAEAKARAQLLPNSIAQAEKAVVLEENNAAIQKVRREQMDGLIKEKDAELKIDKIIEDSVRKIYTIEQNRVTANQQIAQEKIRAANAAAKEEARVAQVLAREARKETDAFLSSEKQLAATYIQQAEALVRLVKFKKGIAAGVALELQYLKGIEAAENNILAIENAKISSQLTGLVTEDSINRILLQRGEILKANQKLRRESLERAAALLELEKKIVTQNVRQATLVNTREGNRNLVERRAEARGGAPLKELEDSKELLEIMEDIAKVKGKASLEDGLNEQNRLRELEQARKLEESMKDLANTVGTTLASAMQTALVDTIDAAITGADDLNEKLKQTAATLLSDLGMAFIKAGISGLGGTDGTGFFSFLSGGLAEGGTAVAGRSYIVGEEGQELFIPGVTGTVVPNDVFEATKEALVDNGEVVPADEADETSAALAANNSSIATTYNSSNNSTGAESGTSENSSAISTAINTGISTALSQNSQSINSTRFGDTTSTSVSEALAVNNQSIQNQKQNATNTMERETMQQMMDSPSKLTVAYESTVINQQEYVTAEQHQKGVTQAAMKGRDMALASLKNSVRARKGIGLA